MLHYFSSILIAWNFMASTQNAWKIAQSKIIYKLVKSLLDRFLVLNDEAIVVLDLDFVNKF